MVAPIQSLANMEMALYGGLGTNMLVPNYLNNYCGSVNDSIFMQPYYNPNYSIPTQTLNHQTGITSQQSNQMGLANSSMEPLIDLYAKNLEPSESFTGALVGGTIMGTMMANPRTIIHPWNSLTSFGDVKEMFKGVREKGSDMHRLWKENNVVMEEAYSQMQRAKARSKSRWTCGLFRKKYTKDEYNQLKNIMQEALDSKDINKIAKATETLRHAYSNNGHIPGLWDKICGKKSSTVLSRIADTDTIAKNTKTLLSNNKMTISKAFKKAGGKVGLAFGLVEVLINLPKIQAAYDKDKENAQKGIETKLGSKQTSQTVVKAAGNAVGWAAGETLGIWGAAKLGAAIGTSFGPGIGTIIGAAAGFLGGSVGMWLAGKGTRALMGDDVSNKIEAEKLAQTQEGKTELLKFAYEKIQKGEEVDPRVFQSVQNIFSQVA